jgi:hypothetical protein
MILRLSRSYPNRHGVPVVERIDAAIFARSYAAPCASCTFCGDACCAFGVCVDRENLRRLEAWAARLERYLGIPRECWFAEESVADPEFPGGSYRRTRVVAGACVFLNRRGRGCLLHAFCLERGIDHHLLKPMLSSLFPLTVEAGLLRPAAEVADDSLVCLGEGVTLYRGAREALHHYYGDGALGELDRLERRGKEGGRGRDGLRG